MYGESSYELSEVRVVGRVGAGLLVLVDVLGAGINGKGEGGAGEQVPLPASAMHWSWLRAFLSTA